MFKDRQELSMLNLNLRAERVKEPSVLVGSERGFICDATNPPHVIVVHPLRGQWDMVSNSIGCPDHNNEYANYQIGDKRSNWGNMPIKDLPQGKIPPSWDPNTREVSPWWQNIDDGEFDLPPTH